MLLDLEKFLWHPNLIGNHIKMKMANGNLGVPGIYNAGKNGVFGQIVAIELESDINAPMDEAFFHL